MANLINPQATILSYDEKVTAYNIDTIIHKNQPRYPSGKVPKLIPALSSLDDSSRLKHIPLDILRIISSLVSGPKLESQFSVLCSLESESPDQKVTEIVGRAESEESMKQFLARPVPKKEYNATQATLTSIHTELAFVTRVFGSRFTQIQSSNHIRIYEDFLSKINFYTTPEEFKEKLDEHTWRVKAPFKLVGIPDNLRILVVTDTKEIRIEKKPLSLDILTRKNIDYRALKAIINLFKPVLLAQKHLKSS